jgi:hypothetical protein
MTVRKVRVRALALLKPRYVRIVIIIIIMKVIKVSVLIPAPLKLKALKGFE